MLHGCDFGDRFFIHLEGERLMKPNVGIIGKGNVGSAVKRGLEKAGYQVRAVGRDLRGVACARAASAPLPRFS